MCVLDHLARPEHFTKEEHKRMEEAARKCRRCDGDGKIGPRTCPVPCPYCHGRGKVCEKCFGDGEIKEKRKCDHCGHEDVIKKPCPNIKPIKRR